MRGWGIGVCLELGLEAFSVFSYIQLQLVANLAGAGNWLIFDFFSLALIGTLTFGTSIISSAIPPFSIHKLQ
jgi:hypothetical protein